MVKPLVSVDANPQNADWTKTSWDLPPYKSAEFMELEPDLANFRHKPVYLHAVETGLIIDDEWAADYTQPAGAEPAKKPAKHLHIHLGGSH